LQKVENDLTTFLRYFLHDPLNKINKVVNIDHAVLSAASTF